MQATNLANKKLGVLFILHYKWYNIPAAFFAMPFFYTYLFFTFKKAEIYKLMGCGRNGTFDIKPDLHQWSIFITTSNYHPQTSVLADIKKELGWFVSMYLQLFTYKQQCLVLEPFATHGNWDGQNPFANHLQTINSNLPIAVLTRATIHINKLKRFWQHVNGVAKQLSTQDGFIYSIGVGEIPWKKQATLSVWKSLDAMKQFAYKQKEHAEVVKKTRAETWYKEDMFTRFNVVHTNGFDW
jgi:heme-degrading monooxygenase HmoA